MINTERPAAAAVRASTSNGLKANTTRTMMAVGRIATTVLLLSSAAPVRSFVVGPATTLAPAPRQSGRFSSATTTPTRQRANVNGIRAAGASAKVLNAQQQQQQETKSRGSRFFFLVPRREASETKVGRGEQVKLAAISAPAAAGTAGVLPSPTKSPVVSKSTTVPSPAKLVYGETAQRSLVKALAWRVTAAVVTLVSSMTFSGSLATAMSIVASDFLTKSFTMFAGERLWNNVKWGQDETGDSAKRSLAKATMWRLFAASNTLLCGIFLAKDLSVAYKIAGSDTVFKTALFFVNERAWANVAWGKQYEPIV